MSAVARPLSVVLAGGGTAGHIEPMLALADALRRRSDGGAELRITCLGTARGMETRLVPARGYDLRLIPPVPLPRKPTVDLLRVPGRVWRAVRRDPGAAGRGGRRRRRRFRWLRGAAGLPGRAPRRSVPIVVHEQNALPGLANRDRRAAGRARRGHRAGHAAAPAASTWACPCGRRSARSTGPRTGPRPGPSSASTPTAPPCWSSAARRAPQSLNRAAVAAADALTEAGVQVLHARGPKNTHVTVPARPAGRAPYVVVDYLERMDLAYAAADLALCRAGAVTVAELSAVGLPAAFVPLPIGNGEQRRNALPVVEAGGGLLVEDAELSENWIESRLVPLLTDPAALAGYAEHAAAAGAPDADERLAAIVRRLGDECRENETGDVARVSERGAERVRSRAMSAARTTGERASQRASASEERNESGVEQ